MSSLLSGAKILSSLNAFFMKIHLIHSCTDGSLGPTCDPLSHDWKLIFNQTIVKYFYTVNVYCGNKCYSCTDGSLGPPCSPPLSPASLHWLWLLPLLAALSLGLALFWMYKRGRLPDFADVSAR